MNSYTENKRYDMFRLSLLGFALTVSSSPFITMITPDRYSYGLEKYVVIFGYPAFGTFLSALFLAGSCELLAQRVKLLAIPCLTFGLMACAVYHPHGNYDEAALWSLLVSTIWLSGILRQRAYQGGHQTSAFTFLAHQVLGVSIGCACLWSSELAVLLSLLYWFGAVAAYLYLWTDTRYGPYRTPDVRTHSL